MEYELYHHGIKGMKWGIRRFQKKDGSLTSRGKARYDPKDKRDETAEEDEKTKRGMKLTDKQKKAIKIGAVVAGTALAAYGGYKLYQLYTGSGSKVDPTTGFRLLDGAESDKQTLSKINPGRIKFLNPAFKNKEIISGSSTNCMLCTTTYELRKRGFDVHAGLEKSGRGYLPDELFPKLFSNYKGTTKVNCLPGPTGDTGLAKLMQLQSVIGKDGPDSRGNVMVWWKGGGGHSMIYENVGGKITFKDGQTGRVYDNFVHILQHVDSERPMELLRTDNLTLNTSSIKDYINTDTTFKTYVKHGKEITTTMANDPVVQLGAATAGTVLYVSALNKKAVNDYKKQHPNTKLSDKEIAKLLSHG